MVPRKEKKAGTKKAGRKRKAISEKRTRDERKAPVRKAIPDKKRMMPIEVKREIIAKHEGGARVIDLARQYKRNSSTICSLIKRKETILASNPGKGIKVMSCKRSCHHDEMERLLSVWLTERYLLGERVTHKTICEKARVIYADIAQGSSGEGSDGKVFKASLGWLDNFRKRTGMVPVLRSRRRKKVESLVVDVDVNVVKDEGAAVEEMNEYVNALVNESVNVIRGGEGARDGKDATNQCENRIGVTDADESTNRADRQADQRDRDYKNRQAGEDRTNRTATSYNQQHEPFTQRQPCAQSHYGHDSDGFTREVKEMLETWERVREFVERNHPDREASSRMAGWFSEACLGHFRNLLNWRTNHY